MVIIAGAPIKTNSLQYKLLDKEYKDLDFIFMQSVLKCTGQAALVTESHLKGTIYQARIHGDTGHRSNKRTCMYYVIKVLFILNPIFPLPASLNKT